MVSTHFKNISPNGNLPQIGMNIKKIFETTTQIHGCTRGQFWHLYGISILQNISHLMLKVQQEINFIGHVTTHAAKKNLYSNLSTWTWRLTLLEDSFTKLLAFKRENRSGVTSLWNLPTVERYFPRMEGSRVWCCSLHFAQETPGHRKYSGTM